MSIWASLMSIFKSTEIIARESSRPTLYRILETQGMYFVQDVRRSNDWLEGEFSYMDIDRRERTRHSWRSIKYATGFPSRQAAEDALNDYLDFHELEPVVEYKRAPKDAIPGLDTKSF